MVNNNLDSPEENSENDNRMYQREHVWQTQPSDPVYEEAGEDTIVKSKSCQTIIELLLRKATDSHASSIAKYDNLKNASGTLLPPKP